MPLALVSALQAIDMTSFYIGIAFFVITFIIVIAIVLARAMSSGGRVQRPVITGTSFPPPPPPDTVLVKCQYCGTEQVWKEACIKCGAPLPKPQMSGA